MAKRLIYPKTLVNEDLNPAFIQFQYYERDSIKDSNIDDIVQLYMPESVGQPSTVSWDTEKFGFVGGTMAAALRKGSMDAAGTFANASEKLRGNALANLGSSAAQLLGGKVSADGILGEVAGKINNPYLTMVFRGVDFRNFAFTFRFTPFSESDCDTIDQIIKTMRSNALPPGSSASDPGPFLGYPKECAISYHWRGAENKWLHKFKKAVCTAVDVDYTSSGMFSVMRNGFPSEITVSTKWSEIELVLRDDVIGDADGNGGGY
jgi:hypothetical protein